MNITDESGDTPLHKACLSGETAAVDKILVKRAGEADLLLTNDAMLTPLHIACREGYSKIVKLLLEYELKQMGDHKNIRVVSITHSTPLHLACESGREEIVKMLLLNSADIFAKRGGRVTAMHIAAKHGHIEIMKELHACSSGENIFEVVDVNDRTPLHYAAKNNQVKMIEYLLEK